MKSYLIRRFLLIIPTFLGISLITFLLVQLSPGNPVFLRLQAMQGAMGTGEVPAEIIEQTQKLYGMGKPLPLRYVHWLGKLVTFDFGESYRDHRPVLDRILEALPITLQLNLTSLFIMYLISIPIGIYSATHQHTRSDTSITVVLFLLYSLPSFWVAMLLMFFVGGGGGSQMLQDVVANIVNGVGLGDSRFGEWLIYDIFHFQWFPIYGFSTTGAEDRGFWGWFVDRVWHLILPVFCLTYASLAVLSRYARAGMIEVVRQDYIRTARAYGFSNRTVIYRYALRNALIPIITLLGTLLPALIAGSVIIETIFTIPGMGRLFYQSILERDYPLIMGIFSFTAVLTLLGLILADILYAITDPRITFK